MAAIKQIDDQLKRVIALEKEKEYSHCLICKRKLKNPKFRKTGIGPKCLEKHRNKKPSDGMIQLKLL